jgi:hypothetical protein
MHFNPLLFLYQTKKEFEVKKKKGIQIITSKDSKSAHALY